MKILSVNYKTVGSLLKKSVKDFWLDDNKDAWFQFTDGSTVCVHVLNPKWETYVALDGRKKKESATNGLSFTDNQDVYLWYTSENEERLFTSRSVIIEFDLVRYYMHDKLDYPTRQYIPVIEFHYYENGEEIASND